MSKAIWHEVECGPYAADLPLWRELARQHGDPVLDLGCGAGRVALDLAREGRRVLGIDREPELVAALNERAGALPAEARLGDVRDLELGREFPLVLAPMQLVQLLAGREERIACLSRIAAHLSSTGRAAIAIAEDVGSGPAGAAPLPDTREIEGRVYSSLPVETLLDGERIVIRRLRQTVERDGSLSEAVDEISLRAVTAGGLEGEAAAAGLSPAGRLEIQPTDDHVGSTVLLLEKGG